MKKSKKATSIAEAMVVLLIVVTWVTWMYKIYDESIKLSDATTNKIQAIQIAKQWIEAFTNIRDTNWLLFSSDYENCWNTLNYEPACIWDSAPLNKIKEWWYYKIYRDPNNKWLLDAGTITTSDYTDPLYLTFHRVWLDNWIYTQTWTVEELKPAFTREIKIAYSAWNTTDPKMTVTSLVQWKDKSTNSVHKVELDQVLSNWKQ